MTQPQDTPATKALYEAAQIARLDRAMQATRNQPPVTNLWLEANTPSPSKRSLLVAIALLLLLAALAAIGLKAAVNTAVLLDQISTEERT